MAISVSPQLAVGAGRLRLVRQLFTESGVAAYELKPDDPLTIAVATLLLGAVAALAGYPPAPRGASRSNGCSAE